MVGTTDAPDVICKLINCLAVVELNVPDSVMTAVGIINQPVADKLCINVIVPTNAADDPKLLTVITISIYAVSATAVPAPVVNVKTVVSAVVPVVPIFT